MTVDFDCADEGGSGLASCEGSVPTAPQLDTSTPGPRSVTVTARDNAGNETVVTHTAQVVDGTAPVITFARRSTAPCTCSAQQVLADYELRRRALGSARHAPATCRRRAGRHLLGGRRRASPSRPPTPPATPRRAASSYRVIYDFRGFLWPVRNRPAVNRVRAGRVRARPLLAERLPRPPRARRRLPAGGRGGVRLGRRAGVRRARARARSRPRAALRAAGAAATRWPGRRGARGPGSCRQLLLGLADGTVQPADYRFKR